MARDKGKLAQLGITHVVNVAAGKFQVDTGAKFYRGMALEYYGIEAEDSPFYDLSVHFLPVARYIQAALSAPHGELLVPLGCSPYSQELLVTVGARRQDFWAFPLFLSVSTNGCKAQKFLSTNSPLLGMERAKETQGTPLHTLLCSLLFPSLSAPLTASTMSWTLCWLRGWVGGWMQADFHSSPAGRVLVHCAMGVSRSATLVLAFLMICENMTLVEAIQTVQARREICPNSGFLRQLQVLDNRLGQETGRL